MNTVILRFVFDFCRVLLALQQEQITNVFFDELKALSTGVNGGDWSGKVSEPLTLHQAFIDQKYAKDKRISSIQWHPSIHGSRFIYHLVSKL